MKATIFWALALACLLAGCQGDNGTNPPGQPKPSIAYTSPLSDTVGIAAHHAVNSSGGPVAHYSVEPALPAGLMLDSTSGLISGTPSTDASEMEYYVTASGPGGKDTAVLYLEVVSPYATVVLSIGLKGMNGSGGLAKTSAVVLRKLIVTLTSNITGDSILHDTAVAGSNGFSATATSDQQVMVAFELKPRSWTIAVKTLDANDSVVHAGTVAVANLLSGETRPVTLSLTPRYAIYTLKANFPDSLASASSSSKQKVTFTRIEWRVNGKTVRDSTASFAAFTNHVLAYDYIREGATDTLEFRVYGAITGAIPPWDASSLLYSGKAALSALSPSASNNLTLRWVGPTTGVVDLMVIVARAQYVSIEPVLPGPLLKRRAR